MKNPFVRELISDLAEGCRRALTILKPPRVESFNGIPRSISIRIDPAIESNGVTLEVTPRRRIIVPVDVVREPALAVVVLAREAQMVAADGVREHAAVEGGQARTPDGGPALVGDQFRAAQVIGMHPVQGVVAYQRDGFAMKVDVLGAAVRGGVVFVQQLAVEAVDEARGLAVGSLGHAHAGGGDLVAGVDARAGNAVQAVEAVVAELERARGWAGTLETIGKEAVGVQGFCAGCRCS